MFQQDLSKIFSHAENFDFCFDFTKIEAKFKFSKLE